MTSPLDPENYFLNFDEVHTPSCSFQETYDLLSCLLSPISSPSTSFHLNEEEEGHEEEPEQEEEEDEELNIAYYDTEAFQKYLEDDDIGIEEIFENMMKECGTQTYEWWKESCLEIKKNQ